MKCGIREFWCWQSETFSSTRACKHRVVKNATAAKGGCLMTSGQENNAPFPQPRGPPTGQGWWAGRGQNIACHFAVVHCHCKRHSSPLPLSCGRRGGAKERRRKQRLDTIFHWEPRLFGLTGAFHVCHSELPGVNTGLQTHWEHYCYRKMKASTSLRKLRLYYAFPFSAVIIYPPFFSRTLLNSSKTLALRAVTAL